GILLSLSTKSEPLPLRADRRGFADDLAIVPPDLLQDRTQGGQRQLLLKVLREQGMKLLRIVAVVETLDDDGECLGRIGLRRVGGRNKKKRAKEQAVRHEILRNGRKRHCKPPTAARQPSGSEVDE